MQQQNSLSSLKADVGKLTVCIFINSISNCVKSNAYAASCQIYTLFRSAYLECLPERLVWYFLFIRDLFIREDKSSSAKALVNSEHHQIHQNNLQGTSEQPATRQKTSYEHKAK